MSTRYNQLIKTRTGFIEQLLLDKQEKFKGIKPNSIFLLLQKNGLNVFAISDKMQDGKWLAVCLDTNKIGGFSKIMKLNKGDIKEFFNGENVKITKLGVDDMSIIPV